MYRALKKILFNLDAEDSHRLGLMTLLALQKSNGLAGILSGHLRIEAPELRQSIFGLTFENPVGLAAGFDKNAQLLGSVHSLGFGFTEVGTVTPLPQPGNDRPRLQRLVSEKSLINAMGFNNDGMETIKLRLEAQKPYPIPVGINLGRNKLTHFDQTLDDYVKLVQMLSPVCNYLVINFSSPNTPGLREFENPSSVRKSFNTLKQIANVPMFLKVSPDLSDIEILQVSSAALESGAAGIIATNSSTSSSISRPEGALTGGVSGALLKERSYTVLSILSKELAHIPLISVGGVDSGDEAFRRLRHGAWLVQLYTALIYEGPSLVRRINARLLELLRKDGIAHISELRCAQDARQETGNTP